MKTLSAVKAGLGGGAALLLAGLLAATPAQAAAGGRCLQFGRAHRGVRRGQYRRGRHHQPGPGLHLPADICRQRRERAAGGHDQHRRER